MSAVQHEDVTGRVGGHDEQVDDWCAYMLFYCHTAPTQSHSDTKTHFHSFCSRRLSPHFHFILRCSRFVTIYPLKSEKFPRMRLNGVDVLMACTSRKSVEVANGRVCETEEHVGNFRVRCFQKSKKNN